MLTMVILLLGLIGAIAAGICYAVTGRDVEGY